MIEVLTTMIIATCGSIDNTECFNYLLNCSVDKSGQITYDQMHSCKDNFKKGDRHALDQKN